MQTFDAASLTGTYASMDSAGLSADVVVFKMYNSSNVDVTVSLNGSDDHDIIPSNGTFALDCGINGEGRRPAIEKGKQIYLKGSAGVGTLYVSGYTQARG